MRDYLALDPRDNECGIAVSTGITLIATSDETGLSVALRSVVAFTNGLAVEVDLLARDPTVSDKWQDVMTTSDTNGLHIGFGFMDEPALMPTPAESLDSEPIWLLSRAGGGDTRFSIAWWTAPYPPAQRLIMEIQWRRAAVERVTVAIEVPALADVQQLIIRL
jgi:hypothetical protein